MNTPAASEPEPIRIPTHYTDGEFRGKKRALFAAAALLFIVDQNERLLLLSSDRQSGSWRVPSGSVEAVETVLGAARREVAEELGSAVVVRPLGTVHSFTYLIPSIGYMVDVCYLLAYEGGEIEPGDDEAGSAFRWWTLDELSHNDVLIGVPTDQK